MKTAAMMVLALDLAACAAPSPAETPSARETSPAAQARPAQPAGAAAAASPAAPCDQPAHLGYYGEADPRARAARAVKCPPARDGSELVGRALGEWHLSGWANTGGAAPTLASLRGKVVVVRFWTVGCPFCERTMPALQKLSEELRDQPVTFVGAFHSKPEDAETDLKRPLEAIRDWNIDFPLAIDRQWRTLRDWWLGSGQRHASSVTFVIGKDGAVAHVHPGPEYYPSDDPADADANRDYLALRSAVLAAARM